MPTGYPWISIREWSWYSMKNDTLGERIFISLKKDILSGTYEPGERLHYADIASRMQVSMTPVKEAFLRLEKEGLVRTIARKGTYVNIISDQDIMEYSEIRLAMETLAVKRIITREVTEEELEELREINERLARAIERRRPTECVKIDMDFHQTIVRMSGNTRLVDMLKEFPLSNFLIIMGKGNTFCENGESILDDHNQIIKYIEQSKLADLEKILWHNIIKQYQDTMKNS